MTRILVFLVVPRQIMPWNEFLAKVHLVEMIFNSVLKIYFFYNFSKHEKILAGFLKFHQIFQKNHHLHFSQNLF